MALITCPECGAQISDKAPNCLHCGYPVQDVDKVPDLYYVKRIEDKWVLGKARTTLSRVYVLNSQTTNIKAYDILASGITKDRADMLLEFLENNGGSGEVLVDSNSQSINHKMMDFIDFTFNKNTPVMCPRCKSIQITTGQKGFSLLTGMLGSNKTVNRCAKCGYTWQP